MVRFWISALAPVIQLILFSETNRSSVWTSMSPTSVILRKRLAKFLVSSSQCVYWPELLNCLSRKEFSEIFFAAKYLEHVEDDRAAVFEMSRVLSPSGRIVISVPYKGLGFASFLEALGIKTVHDFQGPEHHFRPGYDENSIQLLLAANGLKIEQSAFYLRFFTRKIATDIISLCNLLYQRFIHRRRTWTWS